MMILQQTRAVLSSGGFDRLAARYIGAVESAGGIVSGTQKNAVDAFFKSGKKDGWISSMRRIYLPIWGLAAPNAVDMIANTSGTFSGTVTHAAGYVQGNGANGYFNSQTSSTTGFGWTAGSAFLGFLCTQADTRNDLRHFCGYTTGTAPRTCINQNASDLFGAHPINGIVAGASGAAIETGIVTLNANATNFRELRRRTSTSVSQIASNTATDTTSPVANNIFFMARNALGSSFNFTNARMGAFYGGSGMASEQCDLFSESLQNLWETCTGLTLP